jgi:hypothetical protein
LLLATLMLLTAALTGCSTLRPEPPLTLQGDGVILISSGVSTPYSGWLIREETLARILEKAESCGATK